MDTALQSATTSTKSAPILTHQDIIRQRRAGVTRAAIAPIKRLARLTDVELASVLGISTRTLHIKSGNDLLSPEAGERLLLFKKLLQHGMAIFEDESTLANWLRTPLYELAIPTVNSTPFVTRPLAEMGQLDRPFPLAGATAGQNLQSGSNNPTIPQSPLDVLDTISGFELVHQVLGRIEWGIYS